MAQWDGKSRGAVVGYRIFIFFIHTLGIRSAYFLLYFVAFYFLIFSIKGSRANYYYFHDRLGFSKIKSIFKVYRSYCIFGQTIIDKVAISSGLRNKFTYEFDGVDILNDLLNKKKGGILISAHVGNFEISEFFFNEIDDLSQINLVTTDGEHTEIKQYLETIASKSDLKFILIKDDLSHIYEINNALNNNELICFTGDRFFEGQKTISMKFLGKEARFPAGTFILGSRLRVPVVFVYVMKESTKHYHLYTRKANFKLRDSRDLLSKYTESITWILKKYPYQWFNYYNFWDERK